MAQHDSFADLNAPKRRIGILTSGGDCPGLNAVIRAVALHAVIHYGVEVVGIQYGTHGLASNQYKILSPETINLTGTDPLLNQGGTILKSINKPKPGDTLENILRGYANLNLFGLIAIGGDGSLRIINDYAKKGNWKFVGVPKTIDNDVALTEKSVGFSTAISTVAEALEKLSDTAQSHDRIMVVEVMGRTVGHLALYSGVAGGADVILLPEFEYNLHRVWNRIQNIKRSINRKFAIVVVAEGCAIPPEHKSQFKNFGEYVCFELNNIAKEVNEEVEIRSIILGHVQRGGAPVHSDRILASAFGTCAVDQLLQQDQNVMVALQSDKIVSVPIEDVINGGTVGVSLESQVLKTARCLGIYCGEFPKITKNENNSH